MIEASELTTSRIDALLTGSDWLCSGKGGPDITVLAGNDGCYLR